MIPIGTGERVRCSAVLSAVVLFAAASLVSCVTVPLYPQPETPAQDRLFDGLLSSITGWGSGGSGSGSGSGWGSTRPNIPDVAGFGMYPLWKFHKFDGLSLRPVPYGVDIGSGLAPVPSPPSYPAGFPGPGTPPAALPPCGNSGPCKQNNYGPPAVAPASNYEPASSAPSYGSAPAAPVYGVPQAPLPNSYSSPSQAQQGGYSASQQAPIYGNAVQAPQIISYIPVAQGGQYAQGPASNYGGQSLSIPYTPVAVGGYDGLASNGYGESQMSPMYGGPPNYGATMNPQVGYDNQQYSNNGISIQFQSPQDYGMQQNNYMTAGSFPMPSYASLENPTTIPYAPVPESKPMQMESGFGGNHFSKRQDASKSDSESDKTTASEGTFNPVS